MIRLKAEPGALPLGAIFAAIAGLSLLAVGLLQLDRLPFSVCAFKLLTGWPCLSCGATRAVARLLAGDLAAAFAMNPLATLLALLLPPWGVGDALLMTRGRALRAELAAPARWLARGTALTLLLGNWVYLVVAGR